MSQVLDQLVFKYPARALRHSRIILADCFEWLEQVPEDCLHAIVTDPPYGVKEYETDQLMKRESGRGGIWRIPPSFDGHTRSPLPRFTALTDRERKEVYVFFRAWALAVRRAMRPGGHVFIATNAIMAQLVYAALVQGGLEFRGQVIRLVRTLRGGDRPKNGEKDYPHVTSLPRGCYEPWGIFRKALPPKMTLKECLATYGTGGLRRTADGRPFEDVIASERTPQRERAIADHPSLKPQSFLRKLVYAALPLGQGIVADPFMGSGSTIAAAEALGLCAVGVERNPVYFELAAEAIGRLKQVQAPRVDALLGVEPDGMLF
ncbi:site-specific DNA-methyltransferase [bacterium]|nr:site-specific DNA-methyltransferase [bacterium]